MLFDNNFFEETPSLMKNSSSSGISLSGGIVDCKNHADKNVYLGTGLCTPKFPTVGVPFDTLGIMLLADRIRDHGNCGSIFHHIAILTQKVTTG